MGLNTGYVQLALGISCRINFGDELELISNSSNRKGLGSSPNLVRTQIFINVWSKLRRDWVWVLSWLGPKLLIKTIFWSRNFLSFELWIQNTKKKMGTEKNFSEQNLFVRTGNLFAWTETCSRQNFFGSLIFSSWFLEGVVFKALNFEFKDSKKKKKKTYQQNRISVRPLRTEFCSQCANRTLFLCWE